MIENSELAFKIFWKVIDNARRMSILMVISILIVLGINLVNNYIIQKNISDILSISKLNDQTLSLKAKSLLIVQIEKEFLLNYNLDLVPRYKEAVIATLDIVEEMKQNPYYFNIAEPAKRMIENVQSLLQQFEVIVATTKKIGVTEDSGLQKDMRDASHEIEQHLQKDSLSNLYTMLLTVRRHEKDFMLRQKQSYFNEWEQALKRLLNEIHSSASIEEKEKKNLEGDLANYDKSFRALTAAITKQETEVKHNTATYTKFTTILEQAYSVLSSFRNAEAKTMKDFLNMMNMIACGVSLALLLIIATVTAYTFWLIRKLRKLGRGERKKSIS